MEPKTVSWNTATAIARNGPAIPGASNTSLPNPEAHPSKARKSPFGPSPKSSRATGFGKMRFDPSKNPPWHSYKNQRRYVMLFGDNHVEYFGFPRTISDTAPVSISNPYW